MIKTIIELTDLAKYRDLSLAGRSITCHAFGVIDLFAPKNHDIFCFTSFIPSFIVIAMHCSCRVNLIGQLATRPMITATKSLRYIFSQGSF